MDENNTKKSFWTRKVSVWHIIYLFIICLLINIFLLCILPGRINDEAYHNFSFAATITSIVLAVVSIVYSIQSGLSSIGQFNGIKEIESQISDEIKRFSNLETSIKNVVAESINPLQASMGDIQQRQEDLQKSQDVLSHNWKEYTELIMIGSATHTPIQGSQETYSQEQHSLDNVPQIFAVILLTCKYSHETQKDIPYHILGKFFGVRSYYCEGVINSLSIFNSENLKVGVGSKSNRQVVTYYKESVLGTIEQLCKLVTEGKNQKLGQDILRELNCYFNDSADSVL